MGYGESNGHDVVTQLSLGPISSKGLEIGAWSQWSTNIEEMGYAESNGHVTDDVT